MKKLAILLGSIILMSGCTTSVMSGVTIGPGGISPNISFGIGKTTNLKEKAPEETPKKVEGAVAN